MPVPGKPNYIRFKPGVGILISLFARLQINL